MKKDNTPPYVAILIFIGLINIIFTTYFMTIMLLGVVFKIFLESLKKENYYLLLLTIIIFTIIEVTQGFKIFSLTIISLGVYYFIIPRVKDLFSSSIVAAIVFIFLFYLVVSIFVFSATHLQVDKFFIFLYNFLIDALIVGFIL